MALTDVVARTAKPREKAYKLADAHGLYLLISPGGSKRWYLKYRFAGNESRIAFGAYPLISLAKAREKRDQVRLLLADGINPAEKREGEKEEAQAALITFEKVARDWHRNISQNRWSETHAGRVRRDMERNILPAIDRASSHCGSENQRFTGTTESRGAKRPSRFSVTATPAGDRYYALCGAERSDRAQSCSGSLQGDSAAEGNPSPGVEAG